MKVAILAGGVGSRLMEETTARPKPMVEIGGKPILWHIMKYYSTFNYDEFVIALGYRGDYIKRWFVEFANLTSDLSVRTGLGEVVSTSAVEDDWTVHLVDTGEGTGTAGRVKRLQTTIGDERFLLTWGDGLADLDIDELVSFHEGHGRLMTMTAVRPPARFGHLEIVDGAVTSFDEKPQIGEGWINGAFFVCEPEVFEYLPPDETMIERGPLAKLAADEQLMAYQHFGFWQCMDTLRDRVLLEKLWLGEDAPWKRWG